MERPIILKSKTVAELPPTERNPRNSEGDFARLPDGRLLFAYSRYVGASGHDDAPCTVAGLVSSDGGDDWEALPSPLVTANAHGAKNVMSVSLQTLSSGEVCLFYLCKQGPQSEVWLRRLTDVRNVRFGEAEPVVPQKKGIYYVINNCRVCVLPNGSLLLPVARHKIVRRADGSRGGVYFGNCVFFRGDPEGRNWRQVSRVQSMPSPGVSATGLQEPGAEVLPDGRVLGYYRTDRGYQFENFSSDGGAHWTRPASSRFSSPDSPMLLLRNPYSGIYYAFWNPIPCYNGRLDPNARWVHAGRTPFVFAQSENGRDWSPFTVLENEPDHGYCYPAVFFLSETELLLSYCCGGGEDGTCLSKTRIRKLVVKG